MPFDSAPVGASVEGDRTGWPEAWPTWRRAPLLLAVSVMGGGETTVAVFGGAHLPRGLNPDCCA